MREDPYAPRGVKSDIPVRKTKPKVVRYECWCSNKEVDPVEMVRYSDYARLEEGWHDVDTVQLIEGGRYELARAEGFFTWFDNEQKGGWFDREPPNKFAKLYIRALKEKP